MRIQRLEIRNFLRIAHAEVDFGASKFSVFYGPNEAGKSSIREAIRFLFDDSSPRAGTRGNFARLIHRTAPEGTVAEVRAVLDDGRELVRDVRFGSPNEALEAFCEPLKGARIPALALGVRRFMAQPDRAKRVSLREAYPDFGVLLVPALLARLRERVNPPDAVLEWIAGELRNGYRQARESILNWTVTCAALPGEDDAELRGRVWKAFEEIPRELRLEQLQPLNLALLRACDAAGPPSWPLVHVEPDLSVSWGCDAYGLASESARWRADALLAGTLSAKSGFGLLALDRADVLDPASWVGLSAWIDGSALEQTLVFLTAPERPSVEWKADPTYFRVDRGVVTHLPV